MDAIQIVIQTLEEKTQTPQSLVGREEVKRRKTMHDKACGFRRY